MVIHDSTTVITKKKKKKNINIYIEGRTIKRSITYHINKNPINPQEQS